MTLHLDAGGLIAVERRDPRAERMVRQARAAGQTWRTHGGIVGQVWRNPERQVALGKVLNAAEVVPLDASLGRDAGLLLAATGTFDVLDAALVAILRDGDQVMTSDPADIALLAEAALLDIEIVQV